MRAKYVGLLLAIPLLACGTGYARHDAYPRPGLLVEPAELARAEAAKSFLILDARERPKYDVGHVPNARWLDAAVWAKAFGKGQDAKGWGERIGALGMGPDSKVVVYDDDRTRTAARVWWILRYWGVNDVRLLNGGWAGWKAGDYPTENTEPAAAPRSFEARARPERLATKEQLLASLKQGSLQIVDARSEQEHCGAQKLNNKRAGAIPGAKQLEWIDLIHKETDRFKSPAEMRKLFDQAGIALDRPAATTASPAAGRQ
jgi:thiosulfate/3-mercaptopyruvate sulfurtransferase